MKPTWRSDDVSLHLGDALEVVPRLPDCSVDCIITDPPYGHNNNNGDLISSREAVFENSIRRQQEPLPRPIVNDGKEADQIFRRIIPEWKRLLASGCCCCCCCGGGGPDPQVARWSLWLDRMLEFKQMIIFDKGPIGMGWHYRRSYETVLVAMKPGGKCRWFDKSQRVENIIRPGAFGIRKIIPSKDDHPTPKPVELAIHFLKLHTQEGDMVLDCFMGAGWVAEACVRMRRKFIGIEIDKRWFDAAIRRVESAQRGLGFGLVCNQAGPSR